MPTPTPSPHRQPLTPAQLEARQTLTHLLTTLSLPASSPTYNRYTPWITKHTIPVLTETLFALIRPQLWTLLSTRLSLDAFKHLAGDLRHEGPGIYFSAILGTDKRLRVYVGQSVNVRARVGQHLNFRHRRDNGCLHYWALEWSVWNVFGVCCALPQAAGGGAGKGGEGRPGMERTDLVLNVLEMWMCLVFRTLPTQTLEEWLQDSDALVDKGRRVAREGVVGGLNVACPLDQGGDVKDMPFVDLSHEEDPVVRGYLKEVQRRKGAEVEMEVERIEGVGQVEVDGEERALRKKMYAEKARRYQRRRDTDIVVPQWVFLGALAVGVGIALFKSGGGLQRGR